MYRQRTIPIVIQLCLFLIFLLFPSSPGHATGLTQRDWMVSMVNPLEWPHTLHDEPQESDYFNVLTGNRRFRFEAEDLTQGEMQVVSIPHLGQPRCGKWLFPAPLPAEAGFPSKRAESCLYGLTLQTMGNPVDISVGDYQEICLEGRTYLDGYPFKSLFFYAGDSDIVLKIPPGGGVELLSRLLRQIGPVLACTLSGIALKAAPAAPAVDRVTTLLEAFGIER